MDNRCRWRDATSTLDRRRVLARLVAEARGLCPETRPARWARATGGRPAPSHAHPRVLVVDDEPLIRDALRLLLETLGARVTEAADGTEALQRLEVGRFDLVLCDLRMPEVDGFAVIRRIRTDHRLRDLPVVAISAVSPEGGPDHLRDAGFDAWLLKPFDLGELIDALDSAGRRAA